MHTTCRAMIIEKDVRSRLRQAFSDRELTLYLGAGVSVASGLPTWEKLVLSIYFATISEQQLGNWRPYPNYLFAISSWYLREVQEPLEITARKLRQMYGPDASGDAEFLRAVRDGLYRIEDAVLGDSNRPEIAGNTTLKAVADLCTAKKGRRYGVKSVITYNYDNLLETALAGRRRASPVFSEAPAPQNRLPIFHVHGYIPFPEGENVEPSGVVFTEEEYNSAASNPYSWSNLVQLREMSSSVGVMVGLSLADRNIRRLLDAIAVSPVQAKIFAVLKKPETMVPKRSEIDKIDKHARHLLEEIKRSGIKSRANAKNKGFFRGSSGKAKYEHEIRGILAAVEENAQEQESAVLRQLGITPIWYSDHTEIEPILREISNV